MTMQQPYDQPYDHTPPPPPGQVLDSMNGRWVPAAPPAPVVDPQLALAQAVALSAARGWKVETWGPGYATLVSNTKPNHILHLLLSVFTGGLWLPIWLLIAVTAKETGIVLSVDQWGRVVNSAAQPARPAVPKTWWARNYGWVVAAGTVLLFVLLAAAG